MKLLPQGRSGNLLLYLRDNKKIIYIHNANAKHETYLQFPIAIYMNKICGITLPTKEMNEVRMNV